MPKKAPIDDPREVRRVRYYVAVAASALLSAILGAAATAVLKAAPNIDQIYAVRRQVVACLPVLTLLGGLLLYSLSSSTKIQTIGRMLFLASVVALMTAIAPAVPRLL